MFNAQWFGKYPSVIVRGCIGKKSFQMLWSTSYYLTRLYNTYSGLVSEEISISKCINWIRQLSITFLRIELLLHSLQKVLGSGLLFWEVFPALGLQFHLCFDDQIRHHLRKKPFNFIFTVIKQIKSDFLSALPKWFKIQHLLFRVN